MFVSRIMAVLAAGAALAPAALTAAPVQTLVDNDGVLTRQIRVDAGDLNLADPKGARALQARVKQAASAVCSGPDIGTAEGRRAITTCKTAAMAGAQRQIEVAMARTTERYASNPAPSPQTTASGS